MDARAKPGQFVLTGSALPADDVTRHTGAGRIARRARRRSSAVGHADTTSTRWPVSALVPDSSLDLRSALENLEKAMIDRALHKAGGNRTEAAALLGLNRTTLVEKLRKYAA